MSNLTNRHEQHTTARGRRPRPSRPSAARRRRAASISDAVIAAYIHELSHAAAPRSIETPAPR